MAEYIERGRLKEAISADCQHLFSFDASFYDMVMIDIDEVPTADVAPVVHGRWIENENFDDGFWVCSSCGFVSEATAAHKLYKFCPNCGADMREE